MHTHNPTYKTSKEVKTAKKKKQEKNRRMPKTQNTIPKKKRKKAVIIYNNKKTPKSSNPKVSECQPQGQKIVIKKRTQETMEK
jgi:hypothetical protein